MKKKKKVENKKKITPCVLLSTVMNKSKGRPARRKHREKEKKGEMVPEFYGIPRRQTTRHNG